MGERVWANHKKEMFVSFWDRTSYGMADTNFDEGPNAPIKKSRVSKKNCSHYH
jgi:hypothetical protein